MAHPSLVPVRPDWLARWHEEPLDRDRPIIDTHHHCMDFPGLRYLAGDLLADIADSGHNIVATVHVDARHGYYSDGPEALRPVGETESLVAVARALPRGSPRLALGMVGFADLGLGAAVGEVLDAHIAAGQGRFRGIRNITPWDADGSLTPDVPPRPAAPVGGSGLSPRICRARRARPQLRQLDLFAAVARTGCARRRLSRRARSSSIIAARR